MTDTPSWDELAPLRRGRIRFWLQAVGSSAPIEHVETYLERELDYAEIADRWGDLGTAGRESAAARLDELFRNAAYATRPYCLRCGQCCANAGPTLYQGDEATARDGTLPWSQLITHRVGERVYSHAKQRTVVLEQECVTVVASAAGGCPLYDRQAKTCRIYRHRPRQCLEQRCWAADDGERLASSAGLRRTDLLPDSSPARPIIEEHERACPPKRLRRLIAAHREGDADAMVAVRAMIAEDERLRQQLLGTGASAEELPFLLGRPLAEQVRAAGIAL
jgi:Fe-S-cluster containining protein